MFIGTATRSSEVTGSKPPSPSLPQRLSPARHHSPLSSTFLLPAPICSYPMTAAGLCCTAQRGSPRDSCIQPHDYCLSYSRSESPTPWFILFQCWRAHSRPWQSVPMVNQAIITIKARSPHCTFTFCTSKSCFSSCKFKAQTMLLKTVIKNQLEIPILALKTHQGKTQAQTKKD